MSVRFEVARRIGVSPARLPGWLERFAARHGQLEAELTEQAVVLRASDGALAQLTNRWEPFGGTSLAEFVSHQQTARRFGLLLVRKGADAVGIAVGEELVAHKVSTHYVQGRTKAGGWSQQRYARRRSNQTRRAFRKAADDAAAVLLPGVGDLECLVTGGDSAAISEVLADPRLQPLAELPDRHGMLGVAEARLEVLRATAVRACQVIISLDELAVGQPREDPRPK